MIGSVSVGPISARAGRRSNRHHATLGRAVALFNAFRVEQTEPDVFYSLLAKDSVDQLRCFANLAGRSVLDVGGGPGYFSDAFRAAGAIYYAIDSDMGELSTRNSPGPGTVLGSGMALPITNGVVDVCYSSNVLEHVSDPWAMADEMLRVTRVGGTVFLSYTTWLSPWGGHETSPWHYLGGRRAADRYADRHGRRPKNDFGTTLFATSAGSMLRWARVAEHEGRAELVAAFPRYHPGWAHWLVRVPGLREVGLWNLVLILRRR